MDLRIRIRKKMSGIPNSGTKLCKQPKMNYCTCRHVGIRSVAISQVLVQKPLVEDLIFESLKGYGTSISGGSLTSSVIIFILSGISFPITVFVL
jgi:hypothetical protein